MKNNSTTAVHRPWREESATKLIVLFCLLFFHPAGTCPPPTKTLMIHSRLSPVFPEFLFCIHDLGPRRLPDRHTSFIMYYNNIVYSIYRMINVVNLYLLTLLRCLLYSITIFLILYILINDYYYSLSEGTYGGYGYSKPCML